MIKWISDFIGRYMLEHRLIIAIVDVCPRCYMVVRASVGKRRGDILEGEECPRCKNHYLEAR